MRGGWRTWLSLTLVALLGLQGCQSNGTRAAMMSDASPRITLLEGARNISALGLDLGPRDHGLMDVCCNFGIGFDKGDAALLIGLLILASPFLIAYAVIAAPLALFKL
jgi:hypothetical protein